MGSTMENLEQFGATYDEVAPEYALVRDTDGERNLLKLFEILPNGQAEARRKRAERVGRQVKLVDMEKIVEQFEIRKNGHDWDELSGVKVGQLDKNKFKSLKTLLNDLNQDINEETAEEVFLLNEKEGMRLALAFLGIAPLKRKDRIREFLRGLSNMGNNECYYWHAKCRSPSNQNGVKALRELLAGHVN